jgi:cation diffusion facilitator CzcD-associated flavoprotein CzcO
MVGPACTRIVIIGAGFGGIGLGIRLKQAGLTDFVILEKSAGVGGVWRGNSYPGAACDVPSHLYSFSFEPKADWPDKYAGQSDILAYLEHCVRKHGLTPHIRLGAEASEARRDEGSACWIVRTAAGDVLETQSLVSATGQLSRPVWATASRHRALCRAGLPLGRVAPRLRACLRTRAPKWDEYVVR